jgi:hypothetical protein
MSEQITTKITIKNHLTRKIIFESTKTTVREAAIEAVKEKKDLWGADLRGAYLQGADLRGAYLRGADLRGAYLRGADGEKLLITSANILSLSGFCSAWRTTTAFITEKGIYIKCGCYEGSIKDFKAKIKTTHGNNKFAKEYLLLCKLIELRFKARLVNEAGIK